MPTSVPAATIAIVDRQCFSFTIWVLASMLG